MVGSKQIPTPTLEALILNSKTRLIPRSLKLKSKQQAKKRLNRLNFVVMVRLIHQKPAMTKTSIKMERRSVEKAVLLLAQLKLALHALELHLYVVKLKPRLKKRKQEIRKLVIKLKKVPKKTALPPVISPPNSPSRLLKLPEPLRLLPVPKAGTVLLVSPIPRPRENGTCPA